MNFYYSSRIGHCHFRGPVVSVTFFLFVSINIRTTCFLYFPRSFFFSRADRAGQGVFLLQVLALQSFFSDYICKYKYNAVPSRTKLYACRPAGYVNAGQCNLASCVHPPHENYQRPTKNHQRPPRENHEKKGPHT